MRNSNGLGTLYRFTNIAAIFILFLVGMAGCGGGGGSAGSATPASLAGASGVAVDPYIVGAVFEEIPAGGGPALQTSTQSDSQGRFTFPRGLRLGSMVRIKENQKGLHNGIPFTGNLQRLVDENGQSLTVSPLTTLLADGFVPEQVIGLLSDAGLAGLRSDDLTADPMARINLRTGTPSARDLLLLQANLAINIYDRVDGQNHLSPAQPINDQGRFAQIVEMVNTALNAEQIAQLHDASIPGLQGNRVDIASCLASVVVIIDTVSQRLQENPGLNPVAEVLALLDRTPELALFYHVMQHRGEPAIEAGIAGGALPDVAAGEVPVIDDNDTVHEGMLPVADAGPNQSVATASLVQLDGSASYRLGNGGGGLEAAAVEAGDESEDDEAGSGLFFHWSMTEKPTGSHASLSDPESRTPTFTPDLDGSYEISLTVTAGGLASLPDSVSITASSGNSQPVAVAGADRVVTVGDTVSLDGTASHDTDGDPLAYVWFFAVIPAGSNTTLDNDTAAAPGFIPDLPGTYIVELLVNDGTSNSLPDSVIVVAQAANIAPVADAGVDRAVITGSQVQLDGSASSDANNEPLSFLWSLDASPAGSNAVLNDATAVNPVFTPDLDGEYAFALTVNDGQADSAPDQVIITAGSENLPPLAVAGPDQNVVTSAQVQLDGSASTDPNNDPLAYAWSFGSRPAGSSAVLSDPAIANPTFTADVDGVYTLNLVVNDSKTDSGPDSVRITASSANSAPVANAGPDQNVAVWDNVQLDGTASYDPDSDPLAYSWTLTSRPAGSAAILSGAGTSMPTFTADQPGIYVASLVVNDGQAASNADSIQINATSSNGAPVADSGIDQSVNTGDLVLFDGSASYDPDNDPLGYLWSITSRPAGSTAVLNGANTVAPTLTVDAAGSFVVSLVVNDGTVDSAPDSMNITVTAPVVNCTLCHGQPPNGTAYPNIQGAHAVHTALQGLQNNCGSCHATAAHNGSVDVAVAASYYTKSGAATYNSAAVTCGNIRCHGGKTTPAWGNGAINVNTQCTSCHQSGTAQYNSYNSGRHAFHVSSIGYACTVCHSTTKLAINHFTTLATSALEGPASATIGGSGTMVASYSGRNCTANCHGTRTW